MRSFNEVGKTGKEARKSKNEKNPSTTVRDRKSHRLALFWYALSNTLQKVTKLLTENDQRVVQTIASACAYNIWKGIRFEVITERSPMFAVLCRLRYSLGLMH